MALAKVPGTHRNLDPHGLTGKDHSAPFSAAASRIFNCRRAIWAAIGPHRQNHTSDLDPYRPSFRHKDSRTAHSQGLHDNRHKDSGIAARQNQFALAGHLLGDVIACQATEPRHSERCRATNPSFCATSQTRAPGTELPATIRAFRSSGQRRRPVGPSRTSIRDTPLRLASSIRCPIRCSITKPLQSSFAGQHARKPVRPKPQDKRSAYGALILRPDRQPRIGRFDHPAIQGPTRGLSFRDKRSHAPAFALGLGQMVPQWLGPRFWHADRRGCAGDLRGSCRLATALEDTCVTVIALAATVIWIRGTSTRPGRA